MKESQKIRLFSVIFLIVFSLSVFVTNHVTRNLLDEDTSGDLLLANCMYDEKTLIPEDWFFGNEFRIYSQLIWAPFFALFSDWGTVRFCGTLVIQLLYLASFVFMMRSARLKKSTILFGCILLLLPYCVVYGRIILYHSHYTMYITFVFLILGLIFRITGGKTKKNRVVPGILLAVCCIFSSLSGIREIYIFLGPLCALTFWQLIVNRKKDFLLPSLFCLMMGVAGWMINRFVILDMIHVGVENASKIEFKGISKVYMTLFAVFRQFGYRSGVNRLSFLGIMSLAGIAVTVYVLIRSGEALIVERDGKRQILRGLLLVQLAINFVTFLFYEPPHVSRYDYSRYLVPSSVWVIPLLCCSFEENRALFRRIMYIGMCCVFIGNGLINLVFFQNSNHFSQDYDGLAYHATDTVEKYSGAAAFIQNEGYDLGYAVNDANVLIEKMNGLPVVWLEKTVDGGMIYRDLLTRKSFRELPAQKTFFLGSFNDVSSFRALPCSEGSELVFSEGDVYIYELAEQTVLKAYLDSRTR